MWLWISTLIGPVNETLFSRYRKTWTVKHERVQTKDSRSFAT